MKQLRSGVSRRNSVGRPKDKSGEAVRIGWHGTVLHSSCCCITLSGQCFLFTSFSLMKLRKNDDYHEKKGSALIYVER